MSSEDEGQPVTASLEKEEGCKEENKAERARRRQQGQSQGGAVTGEVSSSHCRESATH